MDNRSTSVASAHYSLTSVASGLSHCSDFGQESQLSHDDVHINAVTEPADHHNSESVHNAHLGYGDCSSTDNGDSTHSSHSIYNDQHLEQKEKEQEVDDIDLDAM